MSDKDVRISIGTGRKPVSLEIDTSGFRKDIMLGVHAGSGGGKREDFGPYVYRTAGYSKLLKVTDYLYECWYNHIDYGIANDYFKQQGYFPTGACSGIAVRNGEGKSYLGRNFDWFYNNEAEFVVHVSGIKDNDRYIRYASSGVSTGLNILKDATENMDPDKTYAILPFVMLDGINEAGVAAEINVVPTYTGDKANTIVQPAVSKEISLNVGMIIRYILDNFDDAEKAVTYIRDHAEIYFSQKVHDMGYEVHFLVMDSENRYILEFENDSTVVIDCEELPYPVMTNFHINDVIFNSGNEGFAVYSPVHNDGLHNAEVTNHIEPLGSGLERYNILCNEIDRLGTEFDKDDISDVMTKVLYTKSYPTSPIAADPLWYTEFVMGDITCGSDTSAYSDVLEIAGNEYTNRSRDTGITWQSCHSVVYDLEAKKFYLYAQENIDNKYEFELGLDILKKYVDGEIARIDWDIDQLDQSIEILNGDIDRKADAIHSHDAGSVYYNDVPYPEGTVGDTLNNLFSLMSSKATTAELTNAVNGLIRLINALPKDVLLNGTTIVDEDGNANINYVSGGGLRSNENGSFIERASDSDITNRLNNYKPIVPSTINAAIIAALTDANHIVLTEEQQATAQSVLGLMSAEEVGF